MKLTAEAGNAGGDALLDSGYSSHSFISQPVHQGLLMGSGSRGAASFLLLRQGLWV